MMYGFYEQVADLAARAPRSRGKTRFTESMRSYKVLETKGGEPTKGRSEPAESVRRSYKRTSELRV
jgi:hypothetical protein